MTTDITPTLQDLPSGGGDLIQAVRDLSDDALDLLQAEAEDKLDSIKDQIGKVRGEFGRSGRRADPDWFHRAICAERITKRQLQALLRERGRRRKERNSAEQADRQRDYAACLLTALDALVPQELRRQVIEAANRMHQERVA